MPANVQHFPAIPSYVVALSVVAAVVVTAMLIFILYSCLVQRSKKRLGKRRITVMKISLPPLPLKIFLV